MNEIETIENIFKDERERNESVIDFINVIANKDITDFDKIYKEFDRKKKMNKNYEYTTNYHDMNKDYKKFKSDLFMNPRKNHEIFCEEFEKSVENFKKFFTIDIDNLQDYLNKEEIVDGDFIDHRIKELKHYFIEKCDDKRKKYFENVQNSRIIELENYSKKIKNECNGWASEYGDIQ